jgi:hypothetical protein
MNLDAARVGIAMLDSLIEIGFGQRIDAKKRESD